MVLTIAALALLATPFVVSMRFQERSSRHAVAQARARYAVSAAYNHALAQLIRAADAYDHKYGELAMRFDDLPAQFRWLSGQRRLTVGAEVQDEQGKIDLNTAPEALLTNLFADTDAGLGLPRADATALAQFVINARDSAGVFATLDEVCARDAFTEGRLGGADRWRILDLLRTHLTVHAASGPDGAFSPLNINTAPTPVLRAALCGLRLRYVPATPGEANQGDGAISMVDLSSDASGTWEVICTDEKEVLSTGIKTFTFEVRSYRVEGDTAPLVLGTFDLVEDPASPSYVAKSVAVNMHDSSSTEVQFAIYNGTDDFEKDDAFTFHADRLFYTRDETEPTQYGPDDTKAAALLRWFRATVESANDDRIVLDDASGFPVGGGLVRIRGDLIEYGSVNADGKTLEGCTGNIVTPAAGDAVILIVADAEALAKRLDAAVGAKDITATDRAAILANAKGPDASVLLNSTTAFCFRPSGRYTIEAVGAANDEAGREEKQVRVRRVVLIDHNASSPFELTAQVDFDREIRARGLRGLITTPNATYLADVSGSDDAAAGGVTLTPDDEGGKGWDFAVTLDGATNCWAGSAFFAPPEKGTALVAGTDLYKDGDQGLFASKAFRAFAPPGTLRVDSGLRRLMMWVKPGAGFGGDHVFFDTGQTGVTDLHFNRIRLEYRSGKLVFLIADQAGEERSARIEETIPAANLQGGWHKLEALWSGMSVNQMALMLDGRLIGRYHPQDAEAETTGLVDEQWVARIANYLTSQGATPPGSGVRDTEQTSITDPPAGPKTVYGYGPCEFVNRDCSLNTLAFNVVHRGAGALAEEMKTAYASPLAELVNDGDPTKTDGDGNPIPPSTTITVTDASDFPDNGYVKIDDEVIKYSAKAGNVLTIDQAAPDKGRGQDFIEKDGGGNEHAATKFTSEPAEHAVGRSVLCISAKVDDHANYPMPHHINISDGVEDWFGVSGHDQNQCFVQADDEWIGYTHRVEDGAADYLVHVLATSVNRNLQGGGTVTTSSMRGCHGTLVDGHASAKELIPVYRVSAGGRLGAGDRVTLLDDSAPAGRLERVIKRAKDLDSVGQYLVSFADVLPESPTFTIKNTALRPYHARIIKFPTGRYVPKRMVAIGGSLADTDAAQSTVGCVRLFDYGATLTGRRIRGTFLGDEHPTNPADVRHGIGSAEDGGFHCVFGSLDSWRGTGETPEWNWVSNEYGAGTWPLSGYVKIDDEAFFYKLLYPHAVGQSSTLGGIARSPSVTMSGTIAATGDITCPAGVDPIAAGFNPHKGYLVITSTVQTDPAGDRTVTTDEATLQWLIDNDPGVTQADVDKWKNDPNTVHNGDQYTFTIPSDGKHGTATRYELVFYKGITKNGGGTYTFQCADHRSLDGTHSDGHNSDVSAITLTGRNVAMTVLRRGAAIDLSPTAKVQHPAGSRVQPLPNVPATIMPASPYDKNDNVEARFETDRIPAEDVSDFPSRGYLQITDGTNTEILYYTGIEEETVTDPNFPTRPGPKRFFFTGVRRFRGCFGTTPVNLVNPEMTRFDDVQKTDATQTDAYKSDPRRIIRLFRPRVHDGMPRQSPADPSPGEYAPHPNDADLVYFETQKTVRGARWTSIRWEEDLPDDETTDVIVLVRVGDSPDWGAANGLTGSGRVIHKFDAAGTDHDIDEAGDTITVRVFFKFKNGYDTKTRWKVPTLKKLTVHYEAAPQVLESQELSY